MAHQYHHPTMYGQQQQQQQPANHKNLYPPPPGGNYYGWNGQQPEYHGNLYHHAPPPPPPPTGHHHHLPPPPPVHHPSYHHPHQHHPSHQQHMHHHPYPTQYGNHGGAVNLHHHQDHHHLQPYGGGPPPGYPPHLHHHHAIHSMHSIDEEEHGGSMPNDDDDDDLHNLDPIEVLHPEQTLLAPPPDVLPPLVAQDMEDDERVAHTSSAPPVPENITSPCKRVPRKQLDDEDDDATEGGDDMIDTTKRENKFVNGIFREPDAANDTVEEEEDTAPVTISNTNSKESAEGDLMASKSTDTVETATTMAMGKPYYATNSRIHTTSSTEALLNHDDEAFMNNYRSFSEEDTMAPLKTAADFENTAPVYMPPINASTNTAITSTFMDSKGDTVSIEYKDQQQGVVATPKDAENEPPPHHPGNRAAEAADPLRFAVMSPITMCFNRMLGAAEYIKTPAVTKRRTTRHTVVAAEKKRELGACDRNPFDELAADPELERLVILQMALQRQQHGNQFHPHGSVADKAIPPAAPRSKLISEGFFWREYPACEQVLYTHMTRYYEISAIQRNYKTQQSFNNLLVEQVRKAATDNGFKIDPNFDDKKLRDRIRCFYKTHLQNAKKRLITLQKHADLEENRSLVAVFIRCVRDPNLTLEESLNMAETAANKKQRRLDKVEKLRLSVKLHDVAEGTATVLQGV